MGLYEYFLLIFVGMAGMMALYIFINFLQSKDFSYLFYSLNIICIVIMVIWRLIYNFSPTDKNLFVFNFLIPSTQVGSHLFYFLFATVFLDLKKILPELYRFFNITAAVLIVYLMADAIIYFYFENSSLHNILFVWLRIALIAIAMGSVIYAQKKPGILLRLFTMGTFLMVLSAVVSFVFTALKIYPPYGEILRAPFSYFLIGYLLDIVFFTLCLGYKSQLEHREKLQLQAQLLHQKTLEQQERLKLILHTQDVERNRVSAELHDDLGAGLSTIRFLSEVAKSQNKTPEIIELDKISNLSSDLVDNLRQIIWSMHPENNSLQELIEYIHHYSAEYFDNNNLAFTISKPETITDMVISGEARRNIFLSVKESMHNVIKHSGAKNVKIEMIVNAALKIKISDDGIGFSSPQKSESSGSAGNGLKNMKRRMEQINGSFEIISNCGTQAIISYPLV